MKLSISNIAWSVESDASIYTMLSMLDFKGLEIAPTRIFPESPYNHLIEAKEWATKLMEREGLVVSSMQSIWYGHSENMFDSESNRKALIDYTKKAIVFAEAIGCKNLVFGNPRNRDTENIEVALPVAVAFFKEIAEYALEHHTVIALEPNPKIYNTRFMNTTEQAVEMAYKINSNGVRVNVDLGAIIYNEENIDYLKQIPEYINHVHISEPGLKQIEERNLHKELFSVLKFIEYDKFVSIEMGNQNDDQAVQQSMVYVQNIFNE
ncbi:MAG: endonuclease [Bacteroidetes bacterium]|nr:endonuclease [Bacteroidota bacterium]